MASFIVRVRDSKEAVGIFAADDLDELQYLVDEVTDASNCEYAEIRNGGVIWPKRAGPLPIDADWEAERRPVLEVVGVAEITEAWFYAITDEELQFEPLVEARDIIANDP